MCEWMKRFGAAVLSSLLLQSASPVPMVYVSGGSYTPLYTVGQKKKTVKPFYLDRYPVTQADFLAFVKQYPRWQRSKVQTIFAEKDYLKNWPSDLAAPGDSMQSPVNYVSWFAAKAYCKAQGKRLPSGDQWEYAALASDKDPKGALRPPFRQLILDWYGKPTPETLPSVKTGFKNYYGVYGMHGLIWEWVRDFNTVLVTGESREDKGLDRKLFCAGGASGTADPSDYAAYMRYAYRSSLKASYTVKNLGFRCAKEATQ